ncbi:MAG TPA: hypothetical protein VF613_09670, partial [Longimicrobium sp.]
SVAALLAMLSACGPDVASVRDDARTEGAVPRPAVVSPPAPATLGVVFDPARVQVGDTVAGLRVAARDVRRAADGEWVGMVRFAGTVVVQGRTVAHPDYPDVAAPCFAVDEASAARLPRWAGDARRAWFCFANPDLARARLGPPNAPRAASLTVADFTVHYARSDVVNTARLVRADLGPSAAEPRRSGGV